MELSYHAWVRLPCYLHLSDGEQVVEIVKRDVDKRLPVEHHQPIGDLFNFIFILNENKSPKYN
jgi:hypothetical protein